MKKFFRVLAVAGGIILLWGIFFISAYRNIDPDFGWHFQVGKMLWEEGIPNTDPFSYTMPSWPWVDHGRLSDMGIYWLYSNFGQAGLAAVFSAMILLALAIAIPDRLRGWSVFPVLLGLGVLYTRSGVRPQIEDWIGVAILLRLGRLKNKWERQRWLIPILFFVWANFHGGFVAGFAVLAVICGMRWWEMRRLDWKDFAVLLLSVTATLVTPYEFRLWGEIWLTMSDSHLRTSIVEWQPFVAKIEMGFWFLAGVTFALVKIRRKRSLVYKFPVVLMLFLAGISSLRNISLFVLAAIPLVAEGMKGIWDEFATDREKARRAKIFYAGLTLIAVLMGVIEVGVPIWKLMKNGWLNYPEAAVSFLRENGHEGRIFSEYAWGGYLIWKMPGEKVFIDGRMPSWRWKAPEGESDWAFIDYEKIVQGEFGELFEKYGIKTVLWSNGGVLPKDEGQLPERLFGKKKIKTDLVDALKAAGWVSVYTDKVATVYVKGG